MKAFFSQHCLSRIEERLSMSLSELTEILEKDLTVDVAVEPRSNRVHRLFYSYYDQLCFLAVQDGKTGTVVTVVPVNSHGMSKNVSFEAQQAAQQLIDDISAENERVRNELYIDSPGQKIRNRLTFTAYLKDEANTTKIIYFEMKVRLNSDVCLNDLPENTAFKKEFMTTLQQVIEKKNYSISQIQSLYGRTGKREEPVLLYDATVWNPFVHNRSASTH